MVATGGDGEINVSWTPPTGDTASGISVVNQTVRWRTADRTREIAVKTLRPNVESYTVSRLIPGTHYELTVAAVTSAGRYNALNPDTGESMVANSQIRRKPSNPNTHQHTHSHHYTDCHEHTHQDPYDYSDKDAY